MSVVAVVDCGMGNVHSVVAGIRRACAAAEPVVTDQAADIAAADKVVFPGDGNFGACIEEIDKRRLRAPLLAAAREKPFFGICVGMQVLFAGSEEAKAEGLAVFPETVRRLPKGGGRKIPHMGWNQTRHRRWHRWTEDIAAGERFYYVHSYYAPVGESTLMTAEYGVELSAVVGDGGLLATQFHPEKSGEHGMRLLARFINDAKT